MVEPHRRAELVGNEALAGRLCEEASRAVRHGLPLTLLMFHLASPSDDEQSLGQVTRAAALLARAVVRRDDVVGLLGAGAFAIVANATRKGAGTLAEHLGRHIAAFEFTGHDGPVPVELRWALACLSDSETASGLLAKARAAFQPASRGPRVP